MEKVISDDVEMKRSQLRAVKQFMFEPTVDLTPSQTLEGGGTTSSPFLVQSIQDLLLVQNAVNSDGEILSTGSAERVPARTACYKQTDDIDLTACCAVNGSWTPIGTSSVSYDNKSHPFSGSYDGNNKSITNLYINTTINNAGFFGSCSGATINGLSVSGEVSGATDVGLLAGYIEKSGKRTKIINCKSYGSVSGSSNFVGGLIGASNKYTDISGCANYAEVSGVNCVGGIVGEIDGTDIFNCSNSGKVSGASLTGGIVGSIKFTDYGFAVANCFNTGEITASESSVGGIVGQVDTYSYCGGNKIANCINAGKVRNAIIENSRLMPVSNCYWLETASANGVGKLSDQQSVILPLTEAELKGDISTGASLYSDSKGNYYTTLLDALNAWAADNSDDYYNIIYSGWEFTGSAKCPTFTYQAAEKPQSSTEVFFHSFAVTHTCSTFALPFVAGSYTKATINWGDGNDENYGTAASHDYSADGEHTVTVSAENAQSFKLSNIKGVSELHLK